jgi:hypothetical protein
MKTIDNSTDLMNLLESVQMLGTRLEEWNFCWSLDTVMGLPPDQNEEVRGWLVRCSFERPDANGDFSEQGVGYGREWFIAPGTPVTGVVFTAWMAIQQVLIHELHESFTVLVDGERVRLLDPHKELADLAVGSRRIEQE